MGMLTVDTPGYPVSPGRFHGRVCVVTGAASGIGLATANRLWREGAAVVLVDVDGTGLADATAGVDSERCCTQTADVADPRAVEEVIAATVGAFGRLDILVNNAGVAVSGPIDAMSDEDWQRGLAVNAAGVFFGCRAAVRHLVATGGNIVNTASVSGLGGDWNMSVYTAAKGAVTNLTRSLALELGPRGVRVNAVCPTVTLTAMSGPVDQDEEFLALLRPRVPLGRIARAEDVAAAITFLASDDARFITGVNLPVDGGVTASNGQPALH